MIKKLLNTIGIGQLHSVLYTFFLRFYTSKQLSKENKVFKYLYYCTVGFNYIDKYGFGKFIEADFNAKMFYESIHFFDPNVTQNINLIFSKETWEHKDYLKWYKLSMQIQDKASVWVLNHPDLFKNYFHELETIHNEQIDMRKELKENRKKLKRKK
jgi:hypothetical protein